MNAILMNAILSSGSWSISKFLGAMQNSLTYYVKIIVLAIGVVMVGAGIFQVAKNLISHGKSQTNWVVTFALIIIGGTLMLTGGWTVIGNIAQGSKTSLDNMGKGAADKDDAYDHNPENGLTAIIGGNVVAFE